MQIPKPLHDVENSMQRVEAFSDGVFAVRGYYITNAEQKQTAVTFYTIGIFLPAIGWLILWLYASHNKRLLNERLSPAYIRYVTRLYLISNCAYFGAIIISLFNPNAAIIVSIILAFLYLFPPKKTKYV